MHINMKHSELDTAHSRKVQCKGAVTHVFKCRYSVFDVYDFDSVHFCQNNSLNTVTR